MARIRSLKPEYWADQQLAEAVSRDARLAYAGLWNLADEAARLRGDGRYLKGQLFAYDDDLTAADVDALVGELVAAGKVVRYVVSGQTYLYLPNLCRHQRLEPDRVPSKLPPPPEPTDDEPALFGVDAVQIRSDQGVNGSALIGGRGRGHVSGDGADGSAPSPAPSPFCSKHQPDGTDEPCGACGRARRRFDAWQAERRARHATAPPCPTHPGEIAANCRLCAAERKGRT